MEWREEAGSQPAGLPSAALTPSLVLPPLPRADAIAWGLSHTPDIATVEFPTAAAAASSSADATAAADGSSAAPPRHVLIVGTDGLWDTTSVVQACLLALSCDTALEAAHALVDSAYQRWAVETAGVRCDDITVSVAFLPA